MGGHVGESASADIAVERGTRRRIGAGAACEKEVETAIEVAVPKAAAGRLGFDQILFVGPTRYIDEVDAGSSRHIGETRRGAEGGQRVREEQ